MTASKWWLLAVVTAVSVYEIVAATTKGYPTISQDVWAWPLWALVVIISGLEFLTYHFIAGWVKKHRKPEEPV